MLSNWTKLRKKLHGGKETGGPVRKNKKQTLRVSDKWKRKPNTTPKHKGTNSIGNEKTLTDNNEQNNEQNNEPNDVKFDKSLTIHKYKKEEIEISKQTKEIESKIEAIRKKNAKFSKKFNKEFVKKSLNKNKELMNKLSDKNGKNKDKIKNGNNSDNNDNNNNSKNNTLMVETFKDIRNQKREMQLLQLKPPSNISSEERLKFWNNIRINLRARLPKSFLLGIISQTPGNARLHNVNGKLTNVLAMDCEMVGVINTNMNKTNDKRQEYSALARVSIVNFDGQCVYDQFVKPKPFEKIINYRTHVSGILPSDIEKHGIPYDECYSQVFDILKGRKIIGHSIDSDFKVFGATTFQNLLKKEYYIKILNDQINSLEKIRKKAKETKVASKKIRDLKRMIKTLNKSQSHSNIDSSDNTHHFAKKLNYLASQNSYFFDTAKCDLLHKDASKPFGLKFLLELFLGIHIQGSEHDSIQDSVATMALYRCMIPEIQHWIAQQKLEKRQTKSPKTINEKQDSKNNDNGSNGNGLNNKKKKTLSLPNDKNTNDIEMKVNKRKLGKIVNYAYKMPIATDHIPTFGKSSNIDNTDSTQASDTLNSNKSNNAIRNHAAYRNYLFDD